jgi:hypothetical protein
MVPDDPAGQPGREHADDRAAREHSSELWKVAAQAAGDPGLDPDRAGEHEGEEKDRNQMVPDQEAARRRNDQANCASHEHCGREAPRQHDGDPFKESAHGARSLPPVRERPAM